MARIVPSDISRLALAGAHTPELETLRTLKAQLPQDFTVFHGVHWSREYRTWTDFGEIDFAIVNRSGDVLLIEQKNGALAETDAGLVKRYDEVDKNVAEQTRRSLEKVREKFRWQQGRKSTLHLDYLLYCPDYRVRSLNAAGLGASRIVDAGARDGLPARIQSVLGSGGAQGGGHRELVEAFFTQTLDLVPDIHAHVAAGETAFVRRTGALAQILTALEMKPFRLRVAGVPGSGKSFLARDFFERALHADRRPLLVCFNRPLAERLKSRVGAGGYVSTFLGFCDRFLEARGRKPDFGQMDKDPDFWRTVLDRVMGEAIPDDWRFDSLIVDEGQDFEPEWLEILRMFLREDAETVWLEDPDQDLYGKPRVTLEDFVGYRCGVNYRSPESVARFMREHLPFQFQPGNDLPGLGVDVHGYDDPTEQPDLARRIVLDLLRQGFGHEDIVILSCRGMGHSAFSEVNGLGDVRLRRFTGEYDAGGNQLMTDGRLVFDSVYRFKGQEAPAVVLTDIDPEPQRLEQALRVLYCGMTRATVRLDLLVNTSNAEVRGLLA
ncbi:MAG: ATP-binding domain-containing protein [Gammaproteobacteria bacterium]|nr:ATP-binding domain-containing protein [Gammaproteobacteria bacterium]